jgi:arylsulfatase A-like enzyme
VFVTRVPIVLGLILSLTAGFSPTAPAAQAARPNIILILTDDLDAESIAYMPRLRARLAGEGTTFSRFFVTTALCCPSRSSILRGQYVHNHHVYTNTPPRGGFETFRRLGRERSTVATWLRSAGYRTVLMGKYLNGYPDRSQPTYIPAGWEEWYSPSRGGYGNFNYTMNENGRLVVYRDRPEDYMTDVLARKAEHVIRRSSQDGRP